VAPLWSTVLLVGDRDPVTRYSSATRSSDDGVLRRGFFGDFRDRFYGDDRGSLGEVFLILN
jgi:hypothetical protein